MRKKALGTSLLLQVVLIFSINPIWSNDALTMFIRGGVEDTRLEAKAKDTQKKSEAKDSPSEKRHSRGQGQGPRTQAQVLSKKKVFTKIFQAISIK